MLLLLLEHVLLLGVASAAAAALSLHAAVKVYSLRYVLSVSVCTHNPCCPPNLQHVLYPGRLLQFLHTTPTLYLGRRALRPSLLARC